MPWHTCTWESVPAPRRATSTHSCSFRLAARPILPRRLRRRPHLRRLLRPQRQPPRALPRRLPAPRLFPNPRRSRSRRLRLRHPLRRRCRRLRSSRPQTRRPRGERLRSGSVRRPRAGARRGRPRGPVAADETQGAALAARGSADTRRVDDRPHVGSPFRTPCGHDEPDACRLQGRRPPSDSGRRDLGEARSHRGHRQPRATPSQE